jgi:DNA-binding cell septation regulator SpoVG
MEQAMSDFRIRRIVIHVGSATRGYLGIATIDVEWGIHAMQFRGMRIIKRKDSDGLMLAMPSRKNKAGEHTEIVRPVNDETRQLLEESILGEYERLQRQRRARGRHE